MTDQIQVRQDKTDPDPVNTDPDIAEQILAAPVCPVGESQCSVIDQLQALRLEAALLSEQVRTDTLTGLFNFRHFKSNLAREMERTRRTMQSTALLMVDLDFFKQVNDNWGHEVGNQALRLTADIIRKTTRRLDIPCRYGGEEFAIILPATDLITSIQVAERIRAQIEATPLLVDDQELHLTASLGVEVYIALQDDTPEQLVARADDCLYRAKQQGRNQVCHGGMDMGANAAAVSKEEREALSSFFGDDTEVEET